MRRMLVFICLFVFIEGGFSPAVPAFFNYTLEYTAAELQEKIDKKFPLEIKKPFSQFKFEEPRVILKEGNDRIGLQVKVSVWVMEQLAGIGTVELDGKLRYEKEQGALFFDEPELRKLEIEGLPKSLLSQLRELLNNSPFKQHFSEKPLYTLDPKKTGHPLAKLLLKSVTVSHGKLIATMELF
ncbi:DUF1439 domain-containing protein [Deltaproteobacteria bacterium TL4]